MSGILGLAAMIALAGQVRGQEVAPVVVPLTINGIERGDVVVGIAGDDVLMSVADLEKNGATGEAWQRVRLVSAVASPRRLTTLQGREAVWLSSLSPMVSYKFDEANLSLSITFNPRLLGTTVLGSDTIRPKGIIYSADASTFLNYALTSTDFHQPALYGEIGRSVGGKLLYSGFTRGADGSFARGLTNFVIDRRQNLSRWTFGDAIVSTSDPLGGAATLGGITIARNFALDPYFIRQPSMRLRGAATAPSTVDVYVNGVLVAQRQVPPGQFELNDLPVATGAGNVQMVVRNPFGGEQVESFSYYSSTNVLARGLSDFTYSIGKERTGLGSNNSKYDDPVLIAQHRRGITDSLTLGGRIEATRNLWSAGPNLAFRTRIGDFGGGFGFSSDHGVRGTAYDVAYRYLARRWSYGGAVQRFSRDYSNVGLSSVADRATLNANVFLALALGRVSTTLQWDRSDSRDETGTRGVSLLTNFPIGGRLSGYASAGISTIRDVRQKQFSAGVSFYAGHNVTANLTATRTAGVQQMVVDVQRPLLYGTGFGYRFQTLATEGTKSGVGLLQYQGPWGRYEFGVDPYDLSAGRTLTASGGLIYEGGRLALTPPVQDSFALVRVPDVGGVRVYASNQLVGRTDSHGDLFIPTLLTYYGNPIRIDDRDIPLDYDVRAVERIIAPPYRGGALVRFPVERVQSFTGSVIVKTSSATATPSYGQLTIAKQDGATATSPLGREGEFYFADLTPGRYNATIDWSDGRCVFVVELPKTSNSVINMGRLTCTAEASHK